MLKHKAERALRMKQGTYMSKQSYTYSFTMVFSGVCKLYGYPEKTTVQLSGTMVPQTRHDIGEYSSHYKHYVLR